jgi:hypothetical protein
MFRMPALMFLLVTLLAIGRTDDAVREVALEFSGKPIPTQEWAGGVMGNIECDESGSIYFRRAGGAPGSGSALEQPVVRIDRTGQTTEYNLSNVPEAPKDAVTFTFAVDRSGRVFQVVQTHDEEKRPQLYIVSFDRNGEFRWKLALKRPAGLSLVSDFVPSSLIATPYGDFLLTGYEKGVAFTAFFTGDGQLWSSRASASTKGEGKVPVNLGNASAKIGTDGGLYVLQTQRVAVDVFNAETELLRTLALRPPFVGAQPQRLLFAGPRLLVAFQERWDPGEKDKLPKVVYALYDTETAEPIVSYVVPPRSGILACADPERLTFLRPGDGGRFAIVHAPLK